MQCPHGTCFVNCSGESRRDGSGKVWKVCGMDTAASDHINSPSTGTENAHVSSLKMLDALHVYVCQRELQTLHVQSQHHHLMMMAVLSPITDLLNCSKITRAQWQGWSKHLKCAVSHNAGVHTRKHQASDAYRIYHMWCH